MTWSEATAVASPWVAVAACAGCRVVLLVAGMALLATVVICVLIDKLRGRTCNS